MSLDLFFPLISFSHTKKYLVFWHLCTLYEKLVVYQIGTLLQCASSLLEKVHHFFHLHLFTLIQVWEIMFFSPGKYHVRKMKGLLLFQYIYS